MEKKPERHYFGISGHTFSDKGLGFMGKKHTQFYLQLQFSTIFCGSLQLVLLALVTSVVVKWCNHMSTSGHDSSCELIIDPMPFNAEVSR